MEEKERYLKLEKVGRRSPSTLDWVSSLRMGRWLFIGSQTPGKSFCSPPERNTLFRTVLRKQNVACLSVMSLETGFPGGLAVKNPPANAGNLRDAGSKWKWKSLSRVWLCDPMDYGVHGILQARILEWVAFPFSRGSSQPRDLTQVSCIAGRFFFTSHDIFVITGPTPRGI